MTAQLRKLPPYFVPPQIYLRVAYAYFTWRYRKRMKYSFHKTKLYETRINLLLLNKRGEKRWVIHKNWKEETRLNLILRLWRMITMLTVDSCSPWCAMLRTFNMPVALNVVFIYVNWQRNFLTIFLAKIRLISRVIASCKHAKPELVSQRHHRSNL